MKKNTLPVAWISIYAFGVLGFYLVLLAESLFYLVAPRFDFPLTGSGLDLIIGMAALSVVASTRYSTRKLLTISLGPVAYLVGGLISLPIIYGWAILLSPPYVFGISDRAYEIISAILLFIATSLLFGGLSLMINSNLNRRFVLIIILAGSLFTLPILKVLGMVGEGLGTVYLIAVVVLQPLAAFGLTSFIYIQSRLESRRAL